MPSDPRLVGLVTLAVGLVTLWASLALILLAAGVV